MEAVGLVLLAAVPLAAAAVVTRRGGAARAPYSSDPLPSVGRARAIPRRRQPTLARPSASHWTQCVPALLALLLLGGLLVYTTWRTAPHVAAIVSRCPMDSENDPRVNLKLHAVMPSGESYWGLPVTARSEAAMAHFHAGVVHQYGFNRPEARRAHKAATMLDPDCLMCWWGLAYAYTSSLNEPEVSEEELALGMAAAARAAELVEARGSEYDEVELGFAVALSAYYGGDSNETRWREAGGEVVALGKHIEALRTLCGQVGMHATCGSILAENLMKQTSWSYFTEQAGSPHEWKAGSLKPTAAEAAEILGAVLVENPQHPLASHLLVHLFESSDEPWRAERAADALAAHPVGVSHLVHMSGHIYHRIGRYEDSVRAGLAAVESDRLLRRHCGTPYAPQHNVALTQSSAMATGSPVALELAPSLIDVGEEYSTVLTGIQAIPRELVLCRLGGWREILRTGAPAEEAKTNFTAAIADYARWAELVNEGPSRKGSDFLSLSLSLLHFELWVSRKRKGVWLLRARARKGGRSCRCGRWSAGRATFGMDFFPRATLGTAPTASRVRSWL